MGRTKLASQQQTRRQRDGSFLELAHKGPVRSQTRYQIPPPKSAVALSEPQHPSKSHPRISLLDRLTSPTAYDRPLYSSTPSPEPALYHHQSEDELEEGEIAPPMELQVPPESLNDPSLIEVDEEDEIIELEPEYARSLFQTDSGRNISHFTEQHPVQRRSPTVIEIDSDDEAPKAVTVIDLISDSEDESATQELVTQHEATGVSPTTREFMKGTSLELPPILRIGMLNSASPTFNAVGASSISDEDSPRIAARRRMEALLEQSRGRTLSSSFVTAKDSTLTESAGPQETQPQITASSSTSLINTKNAEIIPKMSACGKKVLQLQTLDGELNDYMDKRQPPTSGSSPVSNMEIVTDVTKMSGPEKWQLHALDVDLHRRMDDGEPPLPRRGSARLQEKQAMQRLSERRDTIGAGERDTLLVSTSSHKHNWDPRCCIMLFPLHPSWHSTQALEYWARPFGNVVHACIKANLGIIYFELPRSAQAAYNSPLLPDHLSDLNMRTRAYYLKEGRMQNVQPPPSVPPTAAPVDQSQISNFFQSASAVKRKAQPPPNAPAGPSQISKNFQAISTEKHEAQPPHIAPISQSQASDVFQSATSSLLLHNFPTPEPPAGLGKSGRKAWRRRYRREVMENLMKSRREQEQTENSAQFVEGTSSNIAPTGSGSAVPRSESTSHTASQQSRPTKKRKLEKQPQLNGPLPPNSLLDSSWSNAPMIPFGAPNDLPFSLWPPMPGLPDQMLGLPPFSNDLFGLPQWPMSMPMPMGMPQFPTIAPMMTDAPQWFHGNVEDALGSSDMMFPSPQNLPRNEVVHPPSSSSTPPKRKGRRNTTHVSESVAFTPQETGLLPVIEEVLPIIANDAPPSVQPEANSNDLPSNPVGDWLPADAGPLSPHQSDDTSMSSGADSILQAASVSTADSSVIKVEPEPEPSLTIQVDVPVPANAEIFIRDAIFSLQEPSADHRLQDDSTTPISPRSIDARRTQLERQISQTRQALLRLSTSAVSRERQMDQEKAGADGTNSTTDQQLQASRTSTSNTPIIVPTLTSPAITTTVQSAVQQAIHVPSLPKVGTKETLLAAQIARIKLLMQKLKSATTTEDKRVTTRIIRLCEKEFDSRILQLSTAPSTVVGKVFTWPCFCEDFIPLSDDEED